MSVVNEVNEFGNDLATEIFFLQKVLHRERQGWSYSEAKRATETLNKCSSAIAELSFLLTTVIPDLRAEASGYRPVNWKEECDWQDVVGALKTDYPHCPATLRQLRHSLLRRGFDLSYDYLAAYVNQLIRNGMARVHYIDAGPIENHSVELINAD